MKFKPNSLPMAPFYDTHMAYSCCPKRAAVTLTTRALLLASRPRLLSCPTITSITLQCIRMTRWHLKDRRVVIGPYQKDMTHQLLLQQRFRLNFRGSLRHSLRHHVSYQGFSSGVHILYRIWRGTPDRNYNQEFGCLCSSNRNTGCGVF